MTGSRKEDRPRSLQLPSNLYEFLHTAVRPFSFTKGRDSNFSALLRLLRWTYRLLSPCRFVGVALPATPLASRLRAVCR